MAGVLRDVNDIGCKKIAEKILVVSKTYQGPIGFLKYAHRKLTAKNEKGAYESILIMFTLHKYTIILDDFELDQWKKDFVASIPDQNFVDALQVYRNQRNTASFKTVDLPGLFTPGKIEEIDVMNIVQTISNIISIFEKKQIAVIPPAPEEALYTINTDGTGDLLVRMEYQADKCARLYAICMCALLGGVEVPDGTGTKLNEFFMNAVVPSVRCADALRQRDNANQERRVPDNITDWMLDKFTIFCVAWFNNDGTSLALPQNSPSQSVGDINARVIGLWRFVRQLHEKNESKNSEYFNLLSEILNGRADTEEKQGYIDDLLNMETLNSFVASGIAPTQAPKPAQQETVSLLTQICRMGKAAATMVVQAVKTVIVGGFIKISGGGAMLGKTASTILELFSKNADESYLEVDSDEGSAELQSEERSDAASEDSDTGLTTKEDIETRQSEETKMGEFAPPDSAEEDALEAGNPNSSREDSSTDDTDEDEKDSQNDIHSQQNETGSRIILETNTGLPNSAEEDALNAGAHTEDDSLREDPGTDDTDSSSEEEASLPMVVDNLKIVGAKEITVFVLVCLGDV